MLTPHTALLRCCTPGCPAHAPLLPPLLTWSQAVRKMVEAKKLEQVRSFSSNTPVGEACVAIERACCFGVMLGCRADAQACQRAQGW